MRYKIAITYCDGTGFEHPFSGDDAGHEATSEYAQLLGEALEPTLEHENARHIQMVTLVNYDELGNQRYLIHSGTFLCPHIDTPQVMVVPSQHKGEK